MMKNFQGQIEKTKNLEKELEKVLRTKTITGASGAGLVEITINGVFEVLNVSISEDILSPDKKGMVETLIVSAFGDAVNKAWAVRKEEADSTMKGLLGGIKA